MTNDNAALRIEGLDKRFGLTHANNNISLTVSKGEIRGLAGENGSGKSTLMSMLAGIYPKDSGVIYKNGEPYEVKSPVDAMKNKVGIVVQELGMVGSLPIGVNMFLGRLDQFRGKTGLLDLKKLYQAGEEVLDKWGLGRSVPLRDLAGKHSVEIRKLAELARALSFDPDILIIDEMTQALSHDKRQILYDVIKECKCLGKTIIIISHDLEELIKITDSITVLRDGCVVDTKISADIDADGLKNLMIGREIGGSYYRDDNEASFETETVMEVRGLSGAEGAVSDVSFDLHKGEILAVCGLSDAGIHDLGKTIIGLEKRTAGTVRLTASGKSLNTPQDATGNGVCYLPKDRDGEAMMLNASILDNLCMPSAKKLSNKVGYMSRKKMHALAKKGVENYNVKCFGSNQLCADLSGGNKQKVNLGRWMLYDTEIFVLDCPTRGVDIGVKAFIYSILKDNKEKGFSTLLISDELPEAMGMADRIMVMKNGTIVSTLSRESVFTEEAIIKVML